MTAPKDQKPGPCAEGLPELKFSAGAAAPAVASVAVAVVAAAADAGAAGGMVVPTVGLAAGVHSGEEEALKLNCY